MNREQSMAALRDAYRRNEITLYLGAGVSAGSNIPTWDKLVLSMYFAALSDASAETNLRPFPNYLFAIAEWHLDRCREPLDVTARKIRRYYRHDQFLLKLRETIYAPFFDTGLNRISLPPGPVLGRANPTLDSIAKLCENGATRRHVRAVVTYNYDSLLEKRLSKSVCQAFWSSDQKASEHHVPIYHVHGFVPLNSPGSEGDEIIFTEQQYHQAALDPYSWSNLVQIQHMTSTTGLLIGLSLSDRNIRRLLDAIRKLPERRPQFALLKRTTWPNPSSQELEQIHLHAIDYGVRFAISGIKRENRRIEMEHIIAEVEKADRKQQERILRELGIHVIWYRDHSDIPAILQEMTAG